MSLEVCDILSDTAKEIFSNVTRDTIEGHLRDKYDRTVVYLKVAVSDLKMVLAPFGNFNATAKGDGTNTRQLVKLMRKNDGLEELLRGSPRESRIRRSAQQVLPALLIEFNLDVYIRSYATYTSTDMLNSVLDTFNSDAKTIDFISALVQQANNKNDESFNAVDRMDIVIDGNRVKTTNPSIVPTKSLGIEFYGPIIGGSVLILVIGALVWRRKGEDSSSHPMDEHENETPMSFQNTTAFNESARGDFRLASEIQVDAEEQDISTLGDPNPAPSPFSLINDGQSNPSSGGFDFTRAYGGAAGEGVVSNYEDIQAAVTRQVSTRTEGVYESASSTDQSSIDQENISLFTDDESFERLYGSQKDEDERIELIVPPGKLGVVIDTPLSGIPYVHAIKDSSVLFGQVAIGDKLISVDGIDTTAMSAIKVSKLISSKAENQRTLVFHRTPT